MWKDMNDLSGPTRRRRLVLFAATAAAAACVVSYVFAKLDIRGSLHTGLVSDVGPYSDIADSILGGAVPYLDFPLEHLPSMLVPIISLGWVSDISGISLYFVWPMAMTALFVATAILVDRIDPQRPAGFIFVAMSLPLLPLALFRLEPWVVLLAVGAIVAFLGARNVVGIALVVLGSIAKGWPIVVSILPWKARNKGVAALAAIGSGFALMVIFAQEGFRSGRAFDGIHTETLFGSLVLLARQISGVALDTFPSAGAHYIGVPSWAVFVNAIPGVAVLIVVVVLLWRPMSNQTTVSVIGLGVLGIMLVSPLFSTQFLVWLAPFVAALSYRDRVLYVAAGVFALGSIAIFEPATTMWAIEVTVSNIFVLVLAVAWSWDLLITTRADQRVNTSRKNLPV